MMTFCDEMMRLPLAHMTSGGRRKKLEGGDTFKFFLRSPNCDKSLLNE
jgi:hypothetical protein